MPVGPGLGGKVGVCSAYLWTVGIHVPWIPRAFSSLGPMLTFHAVIPTGDPALCARKAAVDQHVVRVGPARAIVVCHSGAFQSSQNDLPRPMSTLLTHHRYSHSLVSSTAFLPVAFL